METTNTTNTTSMRTDPEALPQTGDILPDAPDVPPERRYPIRIGIDIGKVHDPTAYAVAEVVWRATGRLRQISGRDAQEHPDPRLVRWTGGGWVELAAEPVWLVHQVKRLPTGLDYSEIGRRLGAVICAPRLAGRARSVWLDVTGVGAPVFAHVRDLIAGDLASRDVDLYPVTLTSGKLAGPEVKPSGEVHVGKEWFASNLGAKLAPPPQLLVAADALEAPLLRKELLDYAVKLRERDGHAELGALRPNTWDDMATAVGLLALIEPDLGPGSIKLVGWS
jgi:hypothetical protein